jgi:hypothetical protein
MKLFSLQKVLAKCLLVLTGVAFAGTSAHAVMAYTTGDILIGFRKTGVNEDVVVNLGQADQFRDATSSFVVTSAGNLGAVLTANFGSASWASDPNILWGVLGASGNPFVGPAGDVANTVYVSREQAVLGIPGAATAYSISSSNRGLATTRIATLAGLFDDQTPAAGSTTATRWNNTTLSGAENDWTDTMVGTGRANLTLGVFTPTLVQGQDPSGLANSGLDLYRLLGGQSTTAGVSNEGWFTIDTAGVLTFNVAAVPEPSRFLLLGLGIVSCFMRRSRKLA